MEGKNNFLKQLTFGQDFTISKCVIYINLIWVLRKYDIGDVNSIYHQEKLTESILVTCHSS